MDIKALLGTLVEKGGSDLHVSSGESPMIRVDGDLESLSEAKLSADQVEAMLSEIMDDRQKAAFEETLESDFSYKLGELSRFRVNVFNQRRGPAISFRRIPFEIPTIDQLKLSPIFKELSHFPNGVVLVTGPTGSGKSTTLAAMIDHINRESGKKEHILTIEDPVEYVYTSQNCLINQREVGQDTKSFSNALRAALREDPDIILVGEMRDLETIRLALTAAETGHLVFGTLHTNSAPQTIDRIIDAFPGNEKDMIRAMLAGALRAVVAQTLLKCPQGGRMAAQEIMVCNPAIRNLIRENKIPQILSAIQTGSDQGMRTLEQHIQELEAKNLIIRPDHALSH